MREERGFTLVEALVALAVLAAVLGTVFSVFSSGLKSLRHGDDQLTLAMIAESLLERADLDLAPRPGEVEGTMADGVHWRVTRQAYDPQLLKQNLVVVEAEPPPPLPGQDKDMLPPEDGKAAPAGGRAAGGFHFGGSDHAATGDGPAAAGGGPGFHFGQSEAGGTTPSGRPALGRPEQAKLAGWTVSVAVSNERGQSMVLSKLVLGRQQP